MLRYAVIPALMAGKDVLGIAQTGTGKTAAFVLPLLHWIRESKDRPVKRGCSALILAPTRELAAQINDSIRTYARFMRYSTALVVGGARPGPQIQAIARGVDIIVATPGRLMDHMAAGKVRLDGADLAQWDRAVLGPYLGYLPQDVELFAGTVAENIARFGPVDSEKVVAAARQADVHELILRLPDGYDTKLGEGGDGLSGGQKQRVALARALYGDPVLLVLDEPNANLDENGEAALAATLRRLREAGRTVVLITHRAGVLAVTDRILALKDGAMLRFDASDKVLGSLGGRRPEPTAPAPATTGGLAYRTGFAGGGRP